MTGAEEAPFFSEIAAAPEGAAAQYVLASDGTRLRVGRLGEGDRGTVLLFTGRTEYLEKYGAIAAALAARGWGTLSLDWRGQGLSDRFLPDRSTGHVGRFSDYQIDIAALLQSPIAADMARPVMLLAHSMGGGIGLEALHARLNVNAAAFTGPMWGIALTGLQKPAAWALTRATRLLGLSDRKVPGSGPRTYVLTEPFEDNTLTTDPEMYAGMVTQAETRPELTLGGPSYHWLREALDALTAMEERAAPPYPCRVWLGSRERIVSNDAIRRRMSDWPNGTLTVVQDAEHEVMMERPDIRARFIEEVVAFFEDNR